MCANAHTLENADSMQGGGGLTALWGLIHIY